MQRVSPVALAKLKDVLTHIYWYKRDLRSFLLSSLGESSLLAPYDWENTVKRQIASDLVDSMAQKQDRYLGHLRRLIKDAVEFNDFSHLEALEDGQIKAKKAKEAIASLRHLVTDHDKIVREKEAAEQRRKQEQERSTRNKSRSAKLNELKNRYTKLILSTDPQGRGLELEKLMYDLFDLFDLDPRRSFILRGEQIDGAFTLDATNYIFEGRWRAESSSRGDLDTFTAKVGRKLDTTLGLFLSINGYAVDGVNIHSAGRSMIILMTGADLMAVFDDRIDFAELLRRKKRHASDTGKILFEVHDFAGADV